MDSSNATLLSPSEEDAEALLLARFLIFRGRVAVLGTCRRLGVRCRFEDEDAETEVSRDGEGRSSSEASVSGLEGAEREPGEDAGVSRCWGGGVSSALSWDRHARRVVTQIPGAVVSSSACFFGLGMATSRGLSLICGGVASPRARDHRARNSL
jgi:hypothetical protein